MTQTAMRPAAVQPHRAGASAGAGDVAARFRHSVRRPGGRGPRPSPCMRSSAATTSTHATSTTGSRGSRRRMSRSPRAPRCWPGPRPHRPGGRTTARWMPAKEALAVELEGIRKELLSQANTRLLGRSVFAGTSDTGGVRRGLLVQRRGGLRKSAVASRIAASVRVDTDGAAVFGTGDDSRCSRSSTRSSPTSVPERTSVRASRRSTIDAPPCSECRAPSEPAHSQIERAKEAAVQNSVSLESRARRSRTSIRSRCSCGCRRR